MKVSKTASTVSQRQLEELCRTDSQDIATCLLDAGIEPTDKDRYGSLYPLWPTVRALFARKQGVTSSERLNNERAEKMRTERAILEKEYRPVTEMLEAVAAIGAAVNAEVEMLPAESQEKIAKAIKDAMGALQQEP